MLERAARHKVERDEILRYLSVAGFHPVTPNTLQVYLDERDYPVSDEGLDFHLRYLADEGYVRITESERKVGEKKRIRSVVITAKGVQYIDARSKE